MHQPHPDTQPPDENAEAHKTAVRRLVEEVINAGRLDVIDEQLGLPA